MRRSTTGGGNPLKKEVIQRTLENCDEFELSNFAPTDVLLGLTI